MPENHADDTGEQARRPVKKAKKATAFPPRRPRPAGVFDSVIAGADEVAENAFRAQGGAPAVAPAVAPVGSVRIATPVKSAESAGPTEPTSGLPTQAVSPSVQPVPTVAGVADVPVAPPQPVETPSAEPGEAVGGPGTLGSQGPRIAAAPPMPQPATQPEASPQAVAPQPEPVLRPAPQPEPAPTPVVLGSPEPVQAPAGETPAGGSDPRRTTAKGVPDAKDTKDAEGASARKRVKKKEWAHQAVLESFADAKITSHAWGMHGFRIVPDVLASLKKRVARDRRTSGNAQLAVGHYLDAALRHAPRDVDEQVASAQAFLAERMGFVEAGLQSTYRIGPDARAFATELNLALQEANYGRKGVYVVSAAVIELLRAMEAEGDLSRPAPVRA